MIILLIIIGIIILSSIISDIMIPDSHIWKSILNWFDKIKDYIDDHKTFSGCLVGLLCLFVIYPVCFYWGYNNYKPIDVISLLPQEQVYGHINPALISNELSYQIFRNDSIFVIKTNEHDSIVFNRINNKLVRTASLNPYPNDISIDEERSMSSKILHGVFIIPTWKEVESNLNFASNGEKKVWIVCCMIAGYFGYHQGYKYHKTENYNINRKKSWDYWMKVQSLINNENWWIKLSSKYPYQPSGTVIDEEDPLAAGIGIGFEINNGIITITSVNENSPAQKSGVLEGDRIIAIDGESMLRSDIDVLNVIMKARGYKDSIIRLTIERGNETKEFEIGREIMPIPVSIYYGLPRIYFE